MQTRDRSRPASTFRARLNAEPLGDRVLPAGILAVGTDAGVTATVRTFTDTDANGTYDTLAAFSSRSARPRAGCGSRWATSTATATRNS
jgi:hypothetical protein